MVFGKCLEVKAPLSIGFQAIKGRQESEASDTGPVGLDSWPALQSMKIRKEQLNNRFL